METVGPSRVAVLAALWRIVPTPGQYSSTSIDLTGVSVDTN